MIACESTLLSPASRYKQTRCQAAFSDLYAAYDVRMRRFVYRKFKILDSYLMDDISQAVWLVVAQKIEQFDPSRPFHSWLFKIAYFQALQSSREKWRYHARFGDFFPEDVPDSRSINLESVAIDVEDRCRLREAIHRMRAKYRDAILAMYISGLTYSKAAGKLGISTRSLYCRLKRAKIELKNMLAENNKGNPSAIRRRRARQKPAPPTTAA
jgi:RNA polymerase sigma-70 factor (ECF subfamily)